MVTDDRNRRGVNMRKRILLLVGSVLLAVSLWWLDSRPALAASTSIANMDLLALLNGTPVRSEGGTFTTTDGGTATSATLVDGAPYVAACDTLAFMAPASACSADYTSASWCPPTQANTPYYFRASGTSVSMACSAASCKCAWARMR